MATSWHRKIYVYVLRHRALNLIADTDITLRRNDGEPNLAAIEAAAGLAAGTAYRLQKGQISMSSDVMSALVGLYMAKARVTRATAERRLFDFVDTRAHSAENGPVAAAGVSL